MQGTHWWLVCYDVRDPKRLRKAAKHMEGYGERMQYSVFRCWLNPREYGTIALGADGNPDAGGRRAVHPAVQRLRAGHADDARSSRRTVLAVEPEGHQIV